MRCIPTPPIGGEIVLLGLLEPSATNSVAQPTEAFSHGPEGQESVVEVLAGSVPSVAGRESLLQAALLGRSKAIFSLRLCMPIFH